MSEKLKLKPCPFCGQPRYLQLIQNEGGYTKDVVSDIRTKVDGLFSIGCRSCGARGPEVEVFQEDASTFWNDRPVYDALLSSVRKLVGACSDLDSTSDVWSVRPDKLRSFREALAEFLAQHPEAKEPS